jgi:xylan 1,4-beta-xylosidase
VSRMGSKCQFSYLKSTISFPKYWQACVGSCYAAIGLRVDWQAQLKFIYDTLGIKYVRFHGLLDDDMYVIEPGKKISPLLPVSIRTESFYQIDCLFDAILNLGIRPFVELSFISSVLASGRKVVFHYKGNITPPKHFEEWADLIRHLTQHLIERYGKEEMES